MDEQDIDIIAESFADAAHTPRGMRDVAAGLLALAALVISLAVILLFAGGCASALEVSDLRGDMKAGDNALDRRVWLLERRVYHLERGEVMHRPAKGGAE